MPDESKSDKDVSELNYTELKQALRDARIDRDGWQTQARLAENHLYRILRSPAWKITKPFRILNLLAWKIKPSLNDIETNGWEVKTTGPTVWDLVQEDLVLECANADLSLPKVAILAQWSRSSALPYGTIRLVEELLANNFAVIMVSACEDKDEIRLPTALRNRITIIRKPNYGYDFGSWSVAFNLYPELFDKPEVLTLNDSNAGPFAPISHILEMLRESPYDLTGVTDSLQLRYHLQSYMVHFKNNSLATKALRNFWLTVRNQDKKMAVVQAYELGLTSVAQSSDLYAGAIYPWNLVTDYWSNPSIAGAERLLNLGFPFVKREAIRNSSNEEIIELKSIINKLFALNNDELDRYFSEASY